MNNLDLSFIFGDSAKVKKVEDQGFDLETILYMCKDLFPLLDDLDLSSQELSGVLLRLKIAYDASKGKPVTDLVLYENSRTYPSRLSVESRLSSRTYFFRLLEGQRSVDKLQAKYRCEACTECNLTRTEVKNHVAQVHEMGRGRM